MCKINGFSVEVDYTHISKLLPNIAYWIFESPKLILGLLNEVVKDITLEMYPNYDQIKENIYMKIFNFPL